MKNTSSLEKDNMDINPPGEVTFTYPDSHTVELQLSGCWNIYGYSPAPSLIERQFKENKTARQLQFDTSNLHSWDSSLISFMIRLVHTCKAQEIQINYQSMPEKIYRLLQLSMKPGKAPEEHEAIKKKSIFERSGEETIETYEHALGTITFIGLTVVSMGRALRGKAQFLMSDLWLFLQDAGFRALGVVLLINFLLGLTLAFIGAVQLKQFGAQIYVANLVGIGITREIAPIMTAIIMAGRTGAAYAAQIGAMQANEEIDALKTSAIRPHEFLVLPRMISLILMMPLLCLYADIVGLTGGMMVSTGMLKISFLAYALQTFHAVSMTDIAVGIVKAAIFGVLIALAGCQKGMLCGRSASAVGEAATSAVVKSIIYIVIADALITVFLYALNI